MKPKQIKRSLVFVIFLIIFFVTLKTIVSICEINSTESLPLGIYLKTEKDIERNDIVSFCPKHTAYMQYAEDNGFWKGVKFNCGSTPRLMKKAMGLPYDKIKVKINGVYINGVKVEKSEAVYKILSDKIFETYEREYTLKENEYFMMSDYEARSYDSRYFGIVTKDEIVSVLIPLFVEK